MSNYSPQAPKKLTRSRSNKIVGGVCGGVAQYLNMDVTLVRILTVLISLFTGVPVVLYIIALFVIPEEDEPGAPRYPGVTGAQANSGGYSYPPAAAPEYAPYPPTGAASAPRVGAEDAVWGTEDAPWEQRQADPTPPPEPVAPSEPEAPVVSPEPDDRPKGGA